MAPDADLTRIRNGRTSNFDSLRNPRFSTNFFSYSTSTSTTFTNQYKSDVQICGQCHNARGAAPTDTSRPPHHSPQYNILIGDVGAALGYVPAATTNQLSAHRNIIDQCTHCHTHQRGFCGCAARLVGGSGWFRDGRSRLSRSRTIANAEIYGETDRACACRRRACPAVGESL
jgi:hypothetical protein